MNVDMIALRGLLAIPGIVWAALMWDVHPALSLFPLSLWMALVVLSPFRKKHR